MSCFATFCKTTPRKRNSQIARFGRENPGLITTVVLCALNWSLRKAYKLPKADRVSLIEHILSVAEFEIEHESLCRGALAAYRNGPADFADYLIGGVSLTSGCSVVLTFDKAALKSPGFAEPR